MKEVVFLDRAKHAIQALHFIQALSEGFLIGHKRGKRFYIEDILAVQKGFFPSPDDLLSLDVLYEHRIIGFFSKRDDQDITQNILTPASYGKLFIHFRENHRKQLAWKASVIEYNQNFFLQPLHLSAGLMEDDNE